MLLPIAMLMTGLRVTAMTDSDVGLLSHHAKKPYIASSYVSATGQQQQRLYVALARLVAAGFAVDTDGQRLKVTPAKLLTPSQRGWIKTNLPALVSAVSTPWMRWCVEYPRHAVAADSGTRLVCDYLPFADWRRVSAEYPGATVWPAPDNLDVGGWIDAGMPHQRPLDAA